MQHQFQVTGMTCGHCERAVVHAVRSIDEEALVKVDLPTGQVTVESDKARDAIATAIRAACRNPWTRSAKVSDAASRT